MGILLQQTLGQDMITPHILKKVFFFLVITPLDYKENCFYQTALLIFDLVEQVLTFIQKLQGVVKETAHV